jgi:hypothetical protein
VVTSVVSLLSFHPSTHFVFPSSLSSSPLCKTSPSHHPVAQNFHVTRIPTTTSATTHRFGRFELRMSDPDPEDKHRGTAAAAVVLPAAAATAAAAAAASSLFLAPAPAPAPAPGFLAVLVLPLPIPIFDGFASSKQKLHCSFCEEM